MDRWSGNLGLSLYFIMAMIAFIGAPQVHAATGVAVFLLKDNGGNPVAWAQDDGRFYIKGNRYVTPSIGSYSPAWKIMNGSTTRTLIRLDTGDLYINGLTTGPLTSHTFYISDPTSSSLALLSVSSDGNLHLLDTDYLTTGSLALGPPELPQVTVRGLSPIFPTPNSFANLPGRYQAEAYQGTDPGALANLSPLEIYSMFAFLPNMRWNDSADGWTLQEGPTTRGLELLRATSANQAGGDMGRITFNEAGDAFIVSGDGAGAQYGVSLFNRQPGEDFKHTGEPATHVINQIKALAPGHYLGTRDQLTPGVPRGRILAWYPNHIGLRMNVYRSTPTLPANLEQRPMETGNVADGQLWLAGDLYQAVENMLIAGTNEVSSSLEFMWPSDVVALLRFKNVDRWWPQHQRPFPAIPDGVIRPGNDWDTTPVEGGTYSVIPNGHFHVMTLDGVNPATFTQLVNPTFADEDPDHILRKQFKPEHYMWKGRKFTSPAFIQFGPGYLHYVEPDADAELEADQRHVYAIATHNGLTDADAIYLGRSRVTLPTAPTAPDPHDALWEPWEYYVGTGLDGCPLWSEDVDLAKAVLYEEGAMGMVNAIYEHNTRLYLLATIHMPRNRRFQNVSNRFSIYAARRPWGPWRKVYVNDFNGILNRPAQEMRGQWGAPPNATLMPSPVEVDEDFDQATRTGKVRLWVLSASAWIFGPPLVSGRTGTLLARTFWGIGDPANLGHPDNLIAPWDEYWKQSPYIPQFQEIEIEVADGEPAEGYPAVVTQSYPEFRMEGQFHYDHWGWRPTFGQSDEVTTVSFNLGPKWFGYRFKVGPEDISVKRLARFYLSGNTQPHTLKLVNTSTSATVATATVATGGQFVPATDVAADGYLYSAELNGGSGVTLDAGEEYFLLAREGIADNSLTTHAVERVTLPEDTTTSSVTFTTGYRFRTGPLGLRITRLYRHDLTTGARDMVIDKAGWQIVNSPDQLDFRIGSPIHTDRFSPTNVFTTSVSDSLTTTIGSVTFAYKNVRPIDLEPFTDYYIGVEVESGDPYYDGFGFDHVAYLALARMWFNPNAIQFLHPARFNGGQNRWVSLKRSLLPSIADGEYHDDGVALSPAVEVPLFFDCIIPDRFEGFRNPLGTGVLNPQTHAMDKPKNPAADHITMPMIKAINPNLVGNVKVMGAAMTERFGKYGHYYRNPSTPFNLIHSFDLSHWASFTVARTFGAPNSTFGPMDLLFYDGGSTRSLVHASGSVASVDDFYNADDFEDNVEGLKVDVYNNDRFTTPTVSPIQTEYGDLFDEGARPGIYSGMQIKIYDHDTSLTKVGRYYPPNLSSSAEDAITSHQVVLMRARDQHLVAVGNFDSNDYTSSGGFLYAWLRKPPEDPADFEYDNTEPAQSNKVSLGRGESYIVAMWDFKNEDQGASQFDEDLEGRQFGLVEDYPRFKTGSSLEILGPATADDSSGNPSTGTVTTVWLDSPTTGYAQGYGPLNMLYTSAATSLTLFGTPTDSTTYADMGTQFSGYRAIKVTIGNKPIMVTHLGRFNMGTLLSGGIPPQTIQANVHQHQVLILKVPLGVQDVAGVPSEVVASVTVDGSQNTGNYQYVKLEQPVVLESKTAYFIATYEDNVNAIPQYRESFMYQGTANAQTGAGTLWEGVTVQTDRVYTMNPTGNGQWTTVWTFAPIVNIKAH